LRPRNACHGRQRGSACGQTEKISTRKFHFEPPFTSFDHLVGAREQHGRDREAERFRGLEIDDQLELGGPEDRFTPS
jgi:hypothetical protein